MPFVKIAAYEAVAAFPEAYDPPATANVEPEAAPIITSVPSAWPDISPGALVLPAETPSEPWYLSVVIEAKGEGLFVLQWRDFPDEAAFVRRGADLALLPPGLFPVETAGEVPGA